MLGILIKKRKTRKTISRLSKIGLSKEKEYLVENLSMLVSSGMDFSSALTTLREEMKTRAMKKVLAGIQEDIDAGSSFWRALETAKIFSPNTISLVRIGEESGRLSENLKIIAIQEEKDRDFRSKIHSAMMYPVFVLSLTVIVGVVIAWFILPRLTSVFSSMKLELPKITQALIWFGNFLQERGSQAIPVFLGIIFLVVFFLFYFSKTRFIGQGMLFHLPGTKKLIQQVELSRFGYTFGTLLEAGVPVLETLQSLIDASGFRPYKKLYQHLLFNIEAGNSFKKSFANYPRVKKLIPPSVQQMIVNGQQSGNLSEVLLKVGQNFENKIENTTKNLTVILEPILLVIVWLGVVAVALAVILPIYSLVGGLSKGNSSPPPPPRPSIIVEEKKIEKEKVILYATLSPEISEAPVAEDVLPQLEILSTGIGYLNIRASNSTVAQIVGRAQPGELYEYTEVKNGWYRILLENDSNAWVFGRYIKLKE